MAVWLSVSKYILLTSQSGAVTLPPSGRLTGSVLPRELFGLSCTSASKRGSVSSEGTTAVGGGKGPPAPEDVVLSYQLLLVGADVVVVVVVVVLVAVADFILLSSAASGFGEVSNFECVFVSESGAGGVVVPNTMLPRQ
uniref:Uncharacterized protein n=1 Tax=Anopheles farauti TaxID=69004 RepID=A0A182QWR7_9DIPT